MATERTCRVCGCTDDNACTPPCWWVEAGATFLCSACAPADTANAGDPPPLHGRLVLVDGTEQPLTAVYFGLDADGLSIYRAIATVPAVAVVAGGSAQFDMMPARSRIEVMITASQPPPSELAQFEVPATTCPGCHTKLDGATALNNDTSPPQPGAVTVCFYCAAAAVYDDQLQLRHPTDDELAAMVRDPGFQKARAAALHAIGNRRG
jgi:hypothetical protein